MSPLLLSLPVMLPLAGALLMPLAGPRVRAPAAVALSAVVLGVSAALLWVVAAGGEQSLALGGWHIPLGIRWRADRLAALFILTTAIVAFAVALFAAGFLSLTRAAYGARFWPSFLLLWTALNGVFLSGDVFNLYVNLELLTLAAVITAALPGSADALEGAARYLLVALAGSALYLAGVAFFYQDAATLDLALAAGNLGPAGRFGLALMGAGLMAKGALFPLHGWLPPAHAAAPAPGSALLSALVVKGAFYILLRLWLEIEPAPEAARQLIGACGAGAVLWGSTLALRQSRLKLVVAYSTVAQLGYLLLLFPLAAGPWSGAAFAGGIWLAVAHALAKAAMFLAAGLVLYGLGHDRIAQMGGLARHAPMTVFALALSGLTLMGLPPSGGFVAKWLLLQAAIGSGQWLWALVLIGGGLLAAGYIFRILAATFGDDVPQRRIPRRLEWPVLVLAGAAVLMGLGAETPLRWLQEGAP
jgi:formate hydrogenlyase subunit 3/multisubunit Na+/H+ antiporter MnhD subunit